MIYDAVYASDDAIALSFEQAEHFETERYRQAVAATLPARPVLTDRAEQLSLL